MTERARVASAGEPEPPLFTLIVPAYNVARYLPAFLASVAAQQFPLTDCELIFVDDGSTDRSGQLIKAWIERSAPHARLISQENQGLAAARNAGLAAATGTWVSFPDPDDVLMPDYLRQVHRFAKLAGTDADCLSTHPVILNDATGAVSDTHPLRAKYSGGNQLVDLVRFPEYVQLQAASTFLLRDRIESLQLRFDSRIRPNFEDGAFIGRYLAASSRPLLGIVATAIYHYRQRSDGSSLVQRSWRNEHKYTSVLEHGYLALLRDVAAQRGSVPVWLQNSVLYDLLWYFHHEDNIHSPAGAVPQEWTGPFHDLVRAVMAYIDTETIDRYAITSVSPQIKAALTLGYRRERLRPSTVPLVRIDSDQQIVQIRYFFDGALPQETFRVQNVDVRPIYEKVRDISYLNRVLIRERIVWLSATGTIRVWLDGASAPLHLGPVPPPLYSVAPKTMWRRLTSRRPPGMPRPAGVQPAEDLSAVEPPVTTHRLHRRRVTPTHTAKKLVKRYAPGAVPTLVRVRHSLLGWIKGFPAPRPGPFDGLNPRHDHQVVRRARSTTARRMYRNAWTFIDRDTEAHDNAEHLYRYVSQHQPQINSWFVLRRDSPDWDRLAEEGFRLVPFGSPEHVVLLLNTDHLISSQVDHYIVRPLDNARFGRKSWRFTFLQHGVTKDDLSRWLNIKPISRLVTATTDEYNSIAGDHTPYIFTGKEVRLTGFPRHDRLLELGESAGRPDLIMVAPTWRRSLLSETARGNARQLQTSLADTDFGRAWFGLLQSAQLRKAAERNSLSVMFLPHPNMQAHFTASHLPAWVTMKTYHDSDVQELLARTALLVTDYSSQAFEAAYLERPVVYYQFDRDEFFSGNHVYRRGLWDYDKDGFGPVTETEHDVVTAIGDLLAEGPSDEHRTRMHDAFPFRDGRCSERTFESIAALTEPLTYEQAFPPVRKDG